MLYNKILIKQYGSRNKKLKSAGFNDYDSFLKSDIWSKVKELWEKRKVQNPEWWGKCRICGETRVLVLHHIRYKSVVKVSLSGLVPLCMRHHHQVHEYVNKRKRLSLKQAVKRVKKVYLKK